MYRYSIHSQPPELHKNDFRIFSSRFKKILLKKFITFSEAHFIFDVQTLADICPNSIEREQLEKAVKKIFRGEELVHKFDNDLLIHFPIHDSDDKSLPVLMKGVDPYLLKKSAMDWLLEMREEVIAECILHRMVNVDIETGLPNIQHLYLQIKLLANKEDTLVFLVDIPSPGKNPNDVLRHYRKATLALNIFFDKEVVIHHISQGVFALASIKASDNKVSRMASALLLWLRKEEFKKVHIGYSQSSNVSSNDIESFHEELFDQAWHAMRIASKRGPYSSCDYTLILHPEKHPLRRPSRKIVDKLRRKWRSSALFSIIQFQADQHPSSSLLVEHLQVLFPDIFYLDGEDCYLYIENSDAHDTKSQIKARLDKYRASVKEFPSCSLGIASYPFGNFKKTEILLNCRKALLHGNFLGHGSIVSFDSLSLNISGDIFFGEGDFPKAIKEYKRGLLVDASNVNLLNSLGVTFASMENHLKANIYFKRALKVEPDNFMALYNIGLGEESMGLAVSALKRFEKAFIVLSSIEGEKNFKKDLKLLIGKLSCSTGDHQKCIDILRPLCGEGKENGVSGRAYRHLGTSCFRGPGNHKEAMRWLQKALSYNEFDSEAMSLLGLVYLEAGEGQEIALSLCKKSVELEPTNKTLFLNLASVQFACGKINEAKKNVQTCLNNYGTKIEAQFLLASIYEAEGKLHHANTWFRKLNTYDVNNKKITMYLQSFIRKYDDKN